MKRMRREIQTVGLRNWLWFVLWLRRDEFSHKLDLTSRNYHKRAQLTKRRHLAHKIDMDLGELR